MRCHVLFAIDLLLILAATLLALVLRENLELAEDKFQAFLPYLGATAVTAAVLVPAAGLNRAIWRFSGLPDYLHVAAVMAGVCAGAVALSFAHNRLDGVARSLPFLQYIVGITTLVGVRVVHRLYHAASRRQRLWEAAIRISEKPRELHVIIVGITRLTETYIQALAQFGTGNISVAGLLGSTSKHAGRLLATYPILGSPEDVETILDGLEVHGINVRRIVVAARFRELRLEAQDALLRAERSRNITLQFLTEALGFNGGDGGNFNGRKQESSASLTFPRFDLSSPQLRAVSQRSFWKIKRGLDVVAAFALLLLLLPVFFLVFLAVAADTGFPVIFWQLRPGVGGRSFYLYKFRTMRAPRASDGSRIPDAERTSRSGNILRRTRLDELPQLLNILRGDMSFVGPRPLLPKDQPKDFLARLMVRPGLTGWAQVAGGRDIPAEDKAALDVWYVYNASIRLDLKIAIKTVRIVVFGERICEDSMELAWHDLTSCGIVKFQ